MIPIKLTIKGIYSYIEEQTILFDQLTDTGLFGIFGSVGSGKSTILEAISFALYGETERLNSRDSRAYNMMNLKSNQLSIDFEFYTDTKQKRYRFVVSAKRHTKNFSEVKSFARKSYTALLDEASNIEPEWIPSTQSAEQIIGLNYNNFKRTIIIPQGKFREFLDLKPIDRTRMLNEIFNLQRFDLTPKLNQIKSINDEKIHILTGKLQQYLQLSEIDLTQYKTQLKERLKTEKYQVKLIKTLQQEQSNQTQVKQLFEQLEKAENKIKQLSTLQKDFKQRKKNLLSYITCKQDFSKLLDTQTILDDSVSKKQSQYKQVKQDLDKNTKNKKRIEKELLEINKVYDKKELLQAEADELQHIISIRDAAKEKNILDERIEKGNQVISKQQLDIQDNSKALDLNRQQLQQDKQNLGNISLLNAIKTFYIQQQHLDQTIHSLDQDIKQLEDQFKRIEEHQKKTIPKQFYVTKVTENKQTITDYDFIKESTQSAINSLIKSKAQIQEKIQQVLAQEKLNQWAENLKEGDACPLCGSSDHPHILNLDHLKSKIDNLSQQDKKLDAEIITHQEIFSLVDKGQFEAKNVHENILKLQTKKQQQLSMLDSHYQSFSTIKNSKSESIIQTNDTKLALKTIEQRLNEAEKKQELFSIVENKIIQLENKQASFQINIDKYKEKHQQLKDKRISLETCISSTQALLKLYTLEQLENEADDVLPIMAKSKIDTAKQAENDYQKQSILLENILTQVNQLEGQEKNLVTDLNELESKAEKNQKLIQKKLTKSEYANIESVQQILHNSIDEVKENKEINDFEVQLSIVQANQEKLINETQDKQYDDKSFKLLSQQLLAEEKQLQQCRTQIGAIEQNITKLSQDLKDKQQLEKEQQELTKKEMNIATLAKLFKGQGFVKYISSAYLKNLSKAANERFFTMTKQQFQLEINDNNEFQIRDFLNEGKTRSVKTLSGGQLFQASLALALALADSVQHQLKSNQHFFFLDEGFGSLDSEALHIVFDTLKGLKDEKRLVGIISHVDSLQQEIDIYCQVKKHEETGSAVSYSWEL